MKKIIILPLLSLGLALMASAADVRVTFENVEKFTDFTIHGLSETRSQTLFEKEIERRGLGSVLPDDQVLEIHFRDIDMAGDIQPWRNPTHSNVRYVESIYPPRLEFDYVLRDADGNELASGSDAIRDLNFDMNIRSMHHNDRNFHHEIEALRNWARNHLRGTAVSRS